MNLWYVNATALRTTTNEANGYIQGLDKTESASNGVILAFVGPSIWRLSSRPANPGPSDIEKYELSMWHKHKIYKELKIKVVQPTFSRPFMMYFTKKYFEFLSKLSRATTSTIE